MNRSYGAILVLFLVLMGPTKALLIYAGLTVQMAPAERRAIALRSAAIASFVTFLFLWAGELIIAAFPLASGRCQQCD